MSGRSGEEREGEGQGRKGRIIIITAAGSRGGGGRSSSTAAARRRAAISTGDWHGIMRNTGIRRTDSTQSMPSSRSTAAAAAAAAASTKATDRVDLPPEQQNGRYGRVRWELMGGRQRQWAGWLV